MEQKRCDKCNSPFEPLHWQHYSPREDKWYHTGCFEQWRFPSVLKKSRSQAFKEAGEIMEDVLGKKADDYNSKWGVDTCAALVAAKLQIKGLLDQRAVDKGEGKSKIE